VQSVVVLWGGRVHVEEQAVQVLLVGFAAAEFQLLLLLLLLLGLLLGRLLLRCLLVGGLYQDGPGGRLEEQRWRFDLLLLLLGVVAVGNAVIFECLSLQLRGVTLIGIVVLGGAPAVATLLIFLEDDADEFVLFEPLVLAAFLLFVDQALVPVLHHVLVLLLLQRGHDLRPLLALLQHLGQQDHVLLGLPLALHLCGVQPVQPTLAALLGVSEVLLPARSEELF
jgi:hypothetical protein